MAPEALMQLQALNEPLHSRVLTILKKLENWPAVSGAKPCAMLWLDTIE